MVSVYYLKFAWLGLTDLTLLDSVLLQPNKAMCGGRGRLIIIVTETP